MSFHFRLQKVLRYRERLVARQARILAEATARLQRLRQEETGLASEIEAFSRRCQAAREAGRWVELWRLQTVHLSRLQDLLAAARQRRLAGARTAQQQRQRLVARQREKEVLVKLAERQRRQWQLEEARRHRKQMDEIAAGRACRRPRQSCHSGGKSCLDNIAGPTGMISSRSTRQSGESS